MDTIAPAKTMTVAALISAIKSGSTPKAAVETDDLALADILRLRRIGTITPWSPVLRQRGTYTAAAVARIEAMTVVVTVNDHSMHVEVVTA